MAENKIERKKALSRKSKSEDVKPVTENGLYARRTIISSNSSAKSTKSQLTHMYGSLTESDLTYKVNIFLKLQNKRQRKRMLLFLLHL